MPDGASCVLEDFRQGRAETFEAAFETLFRQHQRAVYGWLLRIVRNPAAAEDLTVETFWRIYRAHARFDPARGFEGWARTIATHAALDWLRAQRPRDRLARRSARAGQRRSSRLGRDPQQDQRGFYAVCHPNCALRPSSPSLKNSRTKKSPTRSASPSRPSSCASFARFGLLRKDLEQQGITP